MGKKCGNLLTDDHIYLYLKKEIPGLQDKIHTEQCHRLEAYVHQGKWFEVQLLFCFKCIQPAFMNLYISPQHCDLYGSHGKKIEMS
jgi:hypothetical protein